MRFAFFGSSEFAKNVLQGLIQKHWQPVVVVTNPPRPQGRKHLLASSPVYLLAQKHNIPLLTPSRLQEESFLVALKQYNLDFALLTAYGKFVPPEVLSIPQKGFVNLHPSLLPKYRGASPIQSAILNGDKETGVTIFLMDDKIDHGPIIQNTKYVIQNTRITYPELSRKLAELGAKLIVNDLPRWLEGKITPLPQNELLASYCSKITREEEKINWHLSAQAIDRKVRAFNPNPGLYTKGDNRIIKIIKGISLPDNSDSLSKKIGETFIYNGQPAVKCSQGFYLIQELKPAGKRIMASTDFLRGNQWFIGLILDN